MYQDRGRALETDLRPGVRYYTVNRPVTTNNWVNQTQNRAGMSDTVVQIVENIGFTFDSHMTLTAIKSSCL